ncbi:CoA transferase [Emcibacter sp. SYSU 3D8]|uniref:CaiB/BaiF CoA transferase family protein n=1 Tax=Emcibacter sp. SYSU 3D8 TaxID=3133969 RepID=UPI0031FE996F
MAEPKRGPLDGVRVVDMSTVLLGPYAGQIMGDLGADVIRVESPKADMTRWAGPSAHRGFSPIFMNCNRNKRSLCLDLKKDGAFEALVEIIRTADVFLHNVRLEAVERLGLGYDAVRAIKPDIVYVHCVGFGSEGAYAGRPAYDDIVQAAAGAVSLNRLIDPDEEPRYIATLAADKTTGLHAAYATLAALFHRERTGEGQFVEVPMLESFTSFLMIEHMNGHTWEPPQGDYGYHRIININRKPYRTKDGFICIMPYSTDQWRAALRLGGIPIADDDPRLQTMGGLARHFRELYGLLADVTGTRTSDEWMTLLSDLDIPVMRVNQVEDLKTEEHLSSVDFFEQREHPSEGIWRSMRQPVKFSATPASVRRDPPGLGEHNRELLLEAGMSPDRIAQLEASGALHHLAPTD